MDAVTDEKRGSYYPAILTLSKKDMLIDGKRVNLSPGMNITAEIKTGQRRVIEFLLSPVQRAGRRVCGSDDHSSFVEINYVYVIIYGYRVTYSGIVFE